MTRAGRVSFFSTSIIEDIEARNTTAAVLDVATGQLAFVVPIKEFVFKRTLMQEHFNENYMESEKFPRATFTGHFTGAPAATLGVNFFGLDQAVPRLSFEYGLTNRLAVGVGRSSQEKTLDGFLKYRAIRQTTGPQPIPVSVTLFASSAITTLRFNTPADRNVASRVTYAY
ncbi:hypothetical protein BEN49_22615 [Hymenobacter coccineus]|uniref:DUF5777 domain-containing protein n=1 Tax=Hymenobacter coccineus TaxID=1908235 RepID=A0A1G1THZ6_9BACT|nr:hypothetical protein BEN49_22615 [Hymenobacter coccineus]